MIIESGVCSRVDVYGFSGGGGKYFSRREKVKASHLPELEHYTRRLLSASGVRGNVCIYGA